MPGAAGTLDRLTGEIGRSLAPLEELLTPERVLQFFADLGRQFPPELLSQGSFVAALGDARMSIGQLGDALDQQSAAITAGDTAPLVAATAELMAAVGHVVQAVGAVGNALGSVGGSLPGMSAPDVQAFADGLGPSLLPFMLITHIEETRARTADALALLGVFDRFLEPGVPGDPTKPPHTVKRLELGRLATFLGSPLELFKQLYGWGTPGFDGQRLLLQLEDLALSMNLLAMILPPQGGAPARLSATLFDAQVDTSGGAPGVRLTLNAPTTQAPPTGLPLSQSWSVDLVAAAPLEPGVVAVVRPPASVSVSPPNGTLQGSFAVRLRGRPAPGASTLPLLGLAGGSRLEAAALDLEAGLKLAWDAGAGQARGEPAVSARLTGGHAELSLGDADSFIGKLLGDSLATNFDLAASWSPSGGLALEGSSGLELALPLHVELGPVELTRLHLGLEAEAGAVSLISAVDLKGDLGPLDASVEHVGIRAILALNDGNLGPADLSFGPVPPKGAGLSLDAGAVVGGGYLYFDPDNDEYAGALELEILGLFSASAIGLITTRLPDGSKGFSLLIIISVEFTPPFQLSWGFTLNAVGGIVGLNRTMALDKLREGVRTNSIASVMFPKDIIENAPRIISDLREIFPPEEDKFLIGPMAKLGWGTPSLITLSLGVIIEIPGNIAIVGILRIALPSEDVALINLQVNFVGTLDFDKKMLTFDASLYESRILWITLEGDMAVRLKWGDPAAFLLSVGGFHPQFEPPPLDLPSPMKRISCSILDAGWGRIRIMQYQAVTSNTVQFGARAELFFGFDEFNVDGHLGFDALFQFNPFKFIIEMSAGLTLHVFGADVLSIRLRFSLQGPTPWRAKGRGSVTILFWDIDVDFDETWGDKKDTTLPSVAVLPRIVEDLSKPSHWNALPPSSATGLWVALRPIEAAEDALVLHPAGSLTVSEKVVPLAFEFDKVGSEEPADVKEARIASATSGAVSFSLTPVKDKFAVAQYKKMSGADSLSAQSFQPFECGITLSASGTVIMAGTAVHRKVRYEITIIDKEPGLSFVLLFVQLLGTSFFAHLLGGSAVALSPLSMLNKKLRDPFEEKIEVVDEPHTVVFAHNNAPFSATATFAGDAMAKNHLAAAVAANPALVGQLQVVPAFEAAAA